MAEIQMDKHERDLVERYGFQVSNDPDGHYRVIDPQMPKNRNTYIGGNLYALLLRAIDERSRAKLNIVEFIPARGESKANSSVGAIIPMPKRRPLKQGKLYTIRDLLIDNPEATIEDIEKGLKELEVNCTRSTIQTVRRDFRETLGILQELKMLK